MDDWLKEIRYERRLTQKILAENIGISQNYYSSIEKGKRRPSPEVAKKIAVYLEFEKRGKHWSDLLNSTRKL